VRRGKLSVCGNFLHGPTAAGSMPGTGAHSAGNTAPAWSQASAAPASWQAEGSGLPGETPAFSPSSTSCFKKRPRRLRGVLCASLAILLLRVDRQTPAAVQACPPRQACRRPTGDGAAIYRQTDRCTGMGVCEYACTHG